MTSYVKVCTVADLPNPGGVLRVEVDDEPVAIVCAGGADFHAIGDTCSHDEVSLTDGEVDGHSIECWLHGSRFDLRTGKALSLPARKPVPVYDIRFDGETVLVSTSPVSATTQESNAR